MKTYHGTKKAILGCFVSAEDFKLLQGEDDLALYQFNKKIAAAQEARLKAQRGET